MHNESQEIFKYVETNISATNFYPISTTNSHPCQYKHKTEIMQQLLNRDTPMSNVT